MLVSLSISQSSSKKLYVYKTDYLPEEFLDQEKKLILKFKDARSADEKTA